MKKLLILATFLLFVPIVNADIEHMSAIIETGQSEAAFRIRILFEDTPNGTFEYPILFPASNFEYSTNFGGTCNPIRKPFGTLVNCDFTESNGVHRTLIMRFTSDNPITISNGQILFNADITAPDSVQKLVIQATLDRGMVLVEDGGVFVPYTPLNGVQGSDGRSIFIVWETEDLQKGEGLDVNIAYEKAVQENTQANFTLIIIGIVILFVIILLAIISHLKSGNHTLLNEDESRVVNMIREDHGMIRQNDVVRETGYSKAKISRLIKDMEKRGIIHTKHIGRNNEIYLGKQEKNKSSKIEEKEDSK